MSSNYNQNKKVSLSKFESMLKTNNVYFFDSTEFEGIIQYYLDVGRQSLAYKAIKLGLEQLNISFRIVTRESLFNYSDILTQDIDFNKIIINTTPLGMYPNTENYPKIPYKELTERHLLFDLIYNPSETLFLKYGREQKSQIKNGLEMLQIQAEVSWNIWNNQVVKY